MPTATSGQPGTLLATAPAANFYVSVFSERPGAGTSRVRNITALNGGPEFSFTEALSLAVN